MRKKTAAMYFENDFVNVVKRETDGLRRSQRLAVKDSLKIRTNASTTLEMFKIQILDMCSLPVTSQNLFYQEKFLDDDTKRLSDYGIRARDTIHLEILEIPSNSTDGISSPLSTPEEGFKGSTLQGNHSENSNNNNTDYTFTEETEVEHPGWTCANCTFRNQDMSTTTCAVCEHERNSTKWMCPQCTYLNYNHMSKCNVCQYKR
eukprot:TRINITY_DN5213_c0_g1_i1.p1 TRINITY_DN5213_c0_g1~~TRINITY_DN5213_c0_g1_i1.p1  ORF type:complete len:228 (-),score=41.61 TRINITY_DN5213_c0_g1_i1:89-700(-)